ncbi:hypothetical protein ACLOJK_007635 [Asimina triloba]
MEDGFLPPQARIMASSGCEQEIPVTSRTQPQATHPGASIDLRLADLQQQLQQPSPTVIKDGPRPVISQRPRSPQNRVCPNPIWADPDLQKSAASTLSNPSDPKQRPWQNRAASPNPRSSKEAAWLGLRFKACNPPFEQQQ